MRHYSNWINALSAHFRNLIFHVRSERDFIFGFSKPRILDVSMTDDDEESDKMYTTECGALLSTGDAVRHSFRFIIW